MQNNLSIITFNTFGVPFHGHNILRTLLKTKIRKRFKIIASELNNSDADILSLQEIYTSNHLNILKKNLTNYKYCYYKKTMLSIRGGLVFFTKLKADVVEFQDFKLKGKLWNKSITGRISNRGILLIKLKNSAIYCLNTHPVQNSDHNYEASNRFYKILKSQLEQISKSTSSLQVNNFVILAGDFNLPKNINLYNEFIRKANLKDVFKNYNTPTLHEEYIYKSQFLPRIDYIFHTQNVFIIKSLPSEFLKRKYELSTGIKLHLSDHIALKAEFILNIKCKDTPSVN